MHLDSTLAFLKKNIICDSSQGGWPTGSWEGKNRSRSAMISRRGTNKGKKKKNLVHVSPDDVFFAPSHRDVPSIVWLSDIPHSQDAHVRAVCLWWGLGEACGEGGKAPASLLNRLAVCSWLERRSSQRGAPGPCQGRRLFGNSIWQAEGSHAGTDTDAAILSGIRLKRTSPTLVESPHRRLSNCQTTNQSHV